MAKKKTPPLKAKVEKAVPVAPLVTAKKPPKSTATALSREDLQKANLPFSKANYRLMLIGLGIIGAGFLLMAAETAEYGFGFLGLTLGPVVTFVGFMFEIVAILYEDKKDQPNHDRNR
ncbi:MAG: DUF3098 domain-containing protein [Bernardetiaceae bacterium]